MADEHSQIPENDECLSIEFVAILLLSVFCSAIVVAIPGLAEVIAFIVVARWVLVKLCSSFR